MVPVKHSGEAFFISAIFLILQSISFMKGLGCGQVVRHRPLEATFAGSNPAAPAIQKKGVSDTLALFFVVTSDE